MVGHLEQLAILDVSIIWQEEYLLYSAGCMLQLNIDAGGPLSLVTEYLLFM